MSGKDRGGPDHTVEPRRQPVDRLLALGTLSLKRHEDVLIAEFVERDGHVRVSSQLLVLGPGEIVTPLHGAKELDGEGRQRLDGVDGRAEGPARRWSAVVGAI